MKNLIPLLLLITACSTTKEISTVGSIERLDPALDAIISPDANIEVIAEGFTWSEGPLWIDSESMLLFTDVPENTAYKWTEKGGKEVYLKPSGFTGTTTTSREPGANGLLLDDEGRLVLCQHGERRLAVMNGDITSPVAEYTSLVDNYQGKRFNSPNDAVMGSNYSFYFTDPPYGLSELLEKDPLKELPYQGVYEATADGEVRLLVDSLTKPNGIGLSPDNKYLYIANSDPERARWYRFELGDSSVISGKIFYDATNHAPGEAGLPDGLKVDTNGNIFASGPGGVYIFNADGKVLGRIKLAAPCSNTGLSGDQKTLFITNNDKVLRVKMRD